jgi:hypothetical protein
VPICSLAPAAPAPSLANDPTPLFTPAPAPALALAARVPKVDAKTTRVFGVAFSEKSLAYLVGLQLMLNDGWHSAIPALSGLVCGVTFASGALGIDQLRFPRPVRNLFEVLLPCCCPAAALLLPCCCPAAALLLPCCCPAAAAAAALLLSCCCCAQRSCVI